MMAACNYLNFGKNPGRDAYFSLERLKLRSERIKCIDNQPSMRLETEVLETEEDADGKLRFDLC